MAQTTTAVDIPSGRWTAQLPNGFSGALTLDVDADRWSLDVWRGGPDAIGGPVLTGAGRFSDPAWFALACVFGAVDLPDL